MLRPLPIYFHQYLMPICGGEGSPICKDDFCECERYWDARNVKITKLAPLSMSTHIKQVRRDYSRQFPWGMFILVVLIACVILAGYADSQWLALTGETP